MADVLDHRGYGGLFVLFEDGLGQILVQPGAPVVAPVPPSLGVPENKAAHPEPGVGFGETRGTA